MTEDEAKTKWCPATRFAVVAGDAHISNKPEGAATDTFCIGSACMAWRVKRLPDGDKYFYCGLAGKP